jgi:putative oxidoreductase
MMLSRLLAPWADTSYAVLRVISGALFSFHGMQKMFGLFGKSPPEVGTQMWLGGVIELVCGLTIAAGLGTRWAAFLASGTMAVAYTQFHWKFELGTRLLPAINKGELAIIYAFLFLYVACRGGGAWSLDERIKPTD